MSPLVNFEILRSREDFATCGKRTSERLLARMHTYVIHQLVLGLERLALAHTILPVADVQVLLRVAHVLHRQMSHNLVHAVEDSRTHLLRVLIDPAAHVVV